MSANIYWRPVAPESSETLGVGAPSAFIEAMRKSFGSFPCSVSRNDIDKLSGMAAVYGSDNNPFQEIIDLLDHHEAIDLWAVY